MKWWGIMLLSFSLTYTFGQPNVKRRLETLLPTKKDAFSLGATQQGWENKNNLDERIKEVRWLPNKMIHLTLRDFMVTTIKLPDWESIVQIEVGEEGNFITRKVGTNILTLRAIYGGADTNLTIVGKTGNVYTFYLKSVSFQDRVLPDLLCYVYTDIGKDYKDIRQLSLEDAKYMTSNEDIPFDPSRLDFDFLMSGSEDIAPQTVYTDGIFTWLDYGKRWNSEDLPTVYLLKDEVESPVNTRSEGSKIIIEAAGDFVLKSGKKRVCIFRERKEN